MPEVRPITQKGRGKVALPQNESVVGLAYAQSYCFGLGRGKGRSRTTADLQLFVHQDFTRKGVGRSLFDRLIQCLSHSYGARDGYAWLNTDENDPT